MGKRRPAVGPAASCFCLPPLQPAAHDCALSLSTPEQQEWRPALPRNKVLVLSKITYFRHRPVWS